MRLIPWRPLRAASRWPRWPAARMVVAALLSFVVALSWLGPVFQLSLVLFGVPLVLAVAATVGLVGAARRRRGSGVVTRVVMATALVPYALAAVWLAAPGSDVAGPVLEAATAAPSRGTNPNAPDPSQPGRFTVRALTYGGGMDRRPHYAAPDLKSAWVDASALLAPWQGFKGEQRRRYWGFGPEAVPLNGRVWVPTPPPGAGVVGPLPLVLLVHGNAHMADPSEDGYGYLGELLASRGFIAAAVDQNFLNASWADDLRNDTAARAWLLLKHLELWRDWNGTPGHVFAGQVDLDRIALVGHSRGGEAVALAAALSGSSASGAAARGELVQLGVAVPALPAPVRAVVAIAPTDGTYRPGGALLALENVSYLGLEGGHDGNGPSLIANHQYRRVSFTGTGDGAAAHFKATVYAHRANHGQFNTEWGRFDLPRPLSWLINAEPLMDGEEQRRLARVYVSAFMEATLRGAREYVPLFRDHGAGGEWLPADRYVTSFEDASFRPSAGAPEAEMATAREAVYSIALPEGVGSEWGLDARVEVVFSVALPAGAESLEVEVEGVTHEGGTAHATRAARFAPVSGMPATRVLKVGALGALLGLDLGEERLAQRYAVPLEALSPAGPAALERVRLRVLGPFAHAVVLERVGVSQAE